MAKAGVVVFPGSNCDEDLVEALRRNGFSRVVKLWHKQTDLENCRMIFIPGGFSYGDYLRSGAIARFRSILKLSYDSVNKNFFEVVFQNEGIFRRVRTDYPLVITFMNPGGKKNVLFGKI